MKIYVGWDSREDIAYQVCRYSIISRQPKAEVSPLKQHELREKGIYTRGIDSLASTEFTFTRFLVPFLNEYKGWAVFVDCDVIFVDNIEKLFNQAKEEYAVMVVQHNYTPTEETKMDNQKQYVYPRKNWSSMILWNCSHPSNSKLTLELINTKPASYLHRFQWLQDKEIGAIHHEWNWLVNWYKEPTDGKPKAIHYTEGGPWFPNYFHCEYGANWLDEKNKYLESNRSDPVPRPFDHVPALMEKLFTDLVNYRVDPEGEIFKITKENIIESIEMLEEQNAFAVEGYRGDDAKGHPYDPYLKSFILGCGGKITNYDKVENSMVPVVFRGITKSKHMKRCESLKRDYYYIDTGYFGNGRKKLYHRITKNAMQNIGPILKRPLDRLEATQVKPQPFTKGRNILLCPPSEKAMSSFGLELEKWLTETIDFIKKYTDRPIIVRTKPSRRDRVTMDTIENALSNDIHCLVTFNSIAATEALLFGKPAFTLGPNAAQSLCLSDLTRIETPYYPLKDELRDWAAHLAYCQFTETEMKNGTAWRILNDQ